MHMSALSTGQQARMPTQFDRGQLSASSFSGAGLFGSLAASARLGLSPRLLPDGDGRNDSMTGEERSARMRSLLTNTDEYWAALSMLPANSTSSDHHGMWDPLAMYARAMEQSLLERVTEQSVLQQTLNASVFGSAQTMLPPTSVPSQPTHDSSHDVFLLSQLQRDYRQRQFMQQIMERSPSRVLPPSMNFGSMNRNWQEESKGQEESKHPSSNFDDAPAPKRQRNS